MNKKPISSRNRPRYFREEEIECPYCHCKWEEKETLETDFYMYLHTKIYYCKKCGEEFVNNVTKDILYKYS